MIQSIILSAAELGTSTQLVTQSLAADSANVLLLPNSNSPPAIMFPLVQGMGFVTGIYNNSTPYVQSSVFFRSVVRVNQAPRGGVTKYRITLEDGKIVCRSCGSHTNPCLLTAQTVAGVR